MAQQEIDVGSIPGDGTGDPLRNAFTKINENFTELYSGNVQVTAANVLVNSVAGRIGNVVLTVNDIAQAASKSYVDSAISANIISATGSITDSLRANIAAANLVIAEHESRITTLESNAASQAVAISNLNNTKASISYVDQSIDLALSSNAILADVASVNANVAAANLAIASKASLSGANFTGNIFANTIVTSNYIRSETYLVGGTQANQEAGERFFANPAALFFGNTANTIAKYYQINLQNLDPTSSGDFVVTADDGSDATNYIAVGINGSRYNDPTYPAGVPHDGYVYVTGGNLNFQSLENNIQFYTGNILLPQVALTRSNLIQLGSNVKIKFADGTVQSTAFGGNADISAINAAILSLQSNATSQALDINGLTNNAATQASAIDTLVANAAAQAVSLNVLNANIGSYQIFTDSNAAAQAALINSINANVTAANVSINTLLSNSSSQSLDIQNLYGNAQIQQSNIISLQTNAATQATQINSINANIVAANTNISSLATTASVQTTQINLINANVTAANSKILSLQANAASQALDINYLYANIALGFSEVFTNSANIAAANSAIIILDANLGSTYTNVSTLQSNAATQALQINQLSADVLTKANLVGAVFSGNVQAEYLLANANVKIGSSLEVGIPGPINYPGLAATFVSNVDSYYQLVVQNLNNGPNASGDIVVTADDGTDTTNYINLGINSSNFAGNFTTPAGDTGLSEFPHDGYIEVIGGNAAMRTDGNIFLAANTKLVALIKDSNFLLFNTDLQFKDGTVMSTANIGAQPYTPNNASHYNGTITNVQQALDELAARLRALGG